jgi:hypothetical protein
MISWRVAALFVVAMLMIVAAVPVAHAQLTVGTVTQLSGSVTIQRTGATIGAAANMPIMLHDQIVTGPSSSLTIGLVDNSSLQLGESSTLTIDDSVLVNGVGAPSQVGLLGGDLHTVILGALRGSSTTFEVNTPNAIGAVRGTNWHEHYDTDEHSEAKGCFQTTEVDVDEGTVQVCNTATPPECKDIQQGHSTHVRCGAFWEAGNFGGLGTAGATTLGVGLAAGVGVGAAAAAGAFNGSNGSNASPSK